MERIPVDVVTTRPSRKDSLGNYPVLLNGKVVGWGSMRVMRHSHHRLFAFYPLGGGMKSVQYAVNAEPWRFDGLGDLKERLAAVLRENGIAV